MDYSVTKCVTFSELENMITLEKLLILKSVPFFQQTPDEVLLQIVTTAVQELIVEKDAPIIKKAEEGKDMYVVVSGQVKVHDGDKLIVTLGERDIFGELSALSFARRVASVSAVSNCVLLKVNGLALYEIMSFDVGLAKGIIAALCERAQSMSMQLQALMNHS